MTSEGNDLVFLVLAVALFAPASLLAAVTPMVTKLRLATLAETGTVVGRLSAYATVGGIAGTVLTGFDSDRRLCTGRSTPHAVPKLRYSIPELC